MKNDEAIFHNTDLSARKERDAAQGRQMGVTEELGFELYVQGEKNGNVRVEYTGKNALVSIELLPALCKTVHILPILQILEKQIKKFSGMAEAADMIAVEAAVKDIALQAVLEGAGYRQAEENCPVSGKIVYRKELNSTEEPAPEETYLIAEPDLTILFVTNNPNALTLYRWMCSQEKSVLLFSDKISLQQIKEWNITYIVSYNYSYIIQADVIEYLKGKVINLHTSLLPWNKGSNPNYWSFIEDSPKGVTIHLMDAKLDTGAILVQREIYFDETKETFKSSYDILNREIISLFKENWNSIKAQVISPKTQTGQGSYHNVQDFKCINERCKVDWDELIADYKGRLGYQD